MVLSMCDIVCVTFLQHHAIETFKKNVQYGYENPQRWALLNTEKFPVWWVFGLEGTYIRYVLNKS